MQISVAQTFYIPGVFIFFLIPPFQNLALKVPPTRKGGGGADIAILCWFSISEC